MATWRQRRAWRREFKSLGIRQVKERVAIASWHEEEGKQEAARRWLRKQELRPAIVTALATIIATIIVGVIAWLGLITWLMKPR